MQKEGVLILIGIIVAALLLLFAADLLGITGRAGDSAPGGPAAVSGKKISSPIPPPGGGPAGGGLSEEEKLLKERIAAQERARESDAGWLTKIIRLIVGEPAKPAIKEESPSPPPQPLPSGGPAR